MGPPLGAHVSVAGGVATAWERGRRIGAEVLQIFSKHSTRWEARALDGGEAAAFREAGRRAGISAVAVHCAYLVNLASSKESVRTRSLYGLEDEASRSAMLGIPYLVLHPGSPGEDTEEEGLGRIGRGLRAFGRLPAGVTLLLENTAGQGSSLGRSLAQLRDMIDRAGAPPDLAVCLDSAHLFAAGCDIRGEEGFFAFVAEMERLSLLPLVRMWHLNDSRGDLGSRVDRHQHIGQGKIGLPAFRRIMTHPAFRGLPMVIETPKDGEDEFEKDIENIATLRKLLA
jgi:deoxyribonuclease-4